MDGRSGGAEALAVGVAAGGGDALRGGVSLSGSPGGCKEPLVEEATPLETGSGPPIGIADATGGGGWRGTGSSGIESRPRRVRSLDRGRGVSVPERASERPRGREGAGGGTEGTTGTSIGFVVSSLSSGAFCTTYRERVAGSMAR